MYKCIDILCKTCIYLSIYLNPVRVSTANVSRSEAVKFPKFQAMEQNTSKSSAWAKKAKEGAQIGWPFLGCFFLSKILGKPTWKVKHQKSESNLGSRLGYKTALFQWKKTEGWRETIGVETRFRWLQFVAAYKTQDTVFPQWCLQFTPPH